MTKNYYVILGVHPGATPEQIKSAYREKVMRFHPDHYGSDSAPFLEVQEAYAILGDGARRAAYDRARQRARVSVRRGPAAADVIQPGRTPAEPLRPVHEPVDLGDVFLDRSFATFAPSFDEIFDRLWSNFTAAPRPKSEKVENLTLEVTLTPAQAMAGGSARIMIPAAAPCAMCDGYGSIGPFECLHCGGRGATAAEHPVRVSYPAGVTNNYAVTVPLDRFAIHNLYLTVRFSVSGA